MGEEKLQHTKSETREFERAGKHFFPDINTENLNKDCVTSALSTCKRLTSAPQEPPAVPPGQRLHSH